MTTPSIAIIGAGAIGGVTAGFLARAGHDVELVAKYQDTVDAASGPGLEVTGVRGEFCQRVPAVATVEELSGPKDFILHATKATDMLPAAQAALPFLKEDGALVSLQNGICEEALAEVVGRDQVVACVVGWGATLHGPGRVEMSSTGEWVLGNLDNRPDGRLSTLRDILSAVVPARLSGNIMGELYSKLIVNSCINSLGAVSGLRLGELLTLRRARNIFIAIMFEAMAVADRLGLKVEPGGGGKLDYSGFLGGRGFLADLKRHLVIRAIGGKYRRLRSSTLQSLERGRPTEIDYLNGYIVAKGRRTGVATPVCDRLVVMIHEIEAGRREISPANLDDPLLG